MKISLRWLSDFLDINIGPQALADALTGAGLEVEGLEEQAAVPGGLSGVVVGHVLEVWQHPGADRLRLTKVDVGQAEPVQIVCGAANVAVGQKVAVALPGAVLYPTGAEEPLKIKAGKIRGEASLGMICAEDELGIGTGHEGILVLDSEAAVGEAAAKALGIESDWILEIGLTPNRGDAASHLGVARDAATLLGVELKKPMAVLPEGLSASRLTVSIEDPADAAHFHAIQLDGVVIGPSPDWLARRLQSIGVATINNVVDITNYLSHHLGQPMHAYDAAKVAGKQLTVRRAGKAQPLHLLDKRVVDLRPEDLVIADANGPVGLAGAIGGMSSAVSDSTTSIILEVGCFHPVAVRKTAAHHLVKTDASFRFERGVDPELGPVALAVAVELLQEVAGATVTSQPAVARGNAPEAKTIAVRLDRLNALIGQEIGRERIEEILDRLGFGLADMADGFLCYVPSHRLYDMDGLADVAEEVIRIYGLNNLALPDSIGVKFFDTAPGWESLDAQTLAADLLAGEGFVEIVTNSLTAAGQDPGPGEEGIVRLLNPLSEELSEMRKSPLPATLGAIAYNANRRQKALKTFEFGRVYGRKEDGSYVERPYLCLAVWGQPEPTWQGKPDVYSFADLATPGYKLLQKLGISPQFQTMEHSQFAGVTSLAQGKRQLALWGEVAPAMLKAADLKGRVFSAIFWWDEVLKASKKGDFKAAEPPKFPEVRRDLSLVVDSQVTYAELQAAAREAERKLLRDVQLFDVFEGASLGEGKKAYALAFTLSDPETTLTETQIEAVMQRLEKRFGEKLGAVVRR